LALEVCSLQEEAIDRYFLGTRVSGALAHKQRLIDEVSRVARLGQQPRLGDRIDRIIADIFAREGEFHSKTLVEAVEGLLGRDRLAGRIDFAVRSSVKGKRVL